MRKDNLSKLLYISIVGALENISLKKYLVNICEYI